MEKPPFDYWPSSRVVGILKCKISNNSWFVSDISLRTQSRQVFISLPNLREGCDTENIGCLRAALVLEASCQWSQFRRPSISRIPTQKSHWRMPWENKLELENFHLWELLWREGVILVNCEPQLHRMMSFQMKSPCRRVDIYQVSPFPTFLLSRVYQLVSKPFPLCVSVCHSKEGEQDGGFCLSEVSILLRIWAVLQLEKLCSS